MARSFTGQKPQGPPETVTFAEMLPDEPYEVVEGVGKNSIVAKVERTSESAQYELLNLSQHALVTILGPGKDRRFRHVPGTYSIQFTSSLK